VKALYTLKDEMFLCGLFSISHNGLAVCACAVYKERNYQFKNNLDMKNEESNTTEKGMAYDRLLCAVCPDCGGDGKETCHNPDHGFIHGMMG